MPPIVRPIHRSIRLRAFRRLVRGGRSIRNSSDWSRFPELPTIGVGARSRTSLDSRGGFAYLALVSVIDQIKTLSPTEAVMAMEALWERLVSAENQPESPDWHREELERRDQLIQSGEAQFTPWEDAKTRIRGRVR
jgi:hypothetical protein